jgi:hypothetical protein
MFRQIPFGVARGNTHQQGRQTLVGAVLADQGHEALVVDDFAAHQLEEMPLQAGEGDAQIFQASERNFTDRRSFQRQRGTHVVGVGDAVHAENLAGEIESGDLFDTLVGHGKGFYGAAADGVHRVEGVTGAVDVFVTLIGPPPLDDAVQLFDLIQFQGQRQAQGLHPAIAAIDVVPVGARVIGHCGHGFEWHDPLPMQPAGAGRAEWR